MKATSKGGGLVEEGLDSVYQLVGGNQIADAISMESYKGS